VVQAAFGQEEQGTEQRQHAGRQQPQAHEIEKAVAGVV